jgi:hypothetical protein
MQLKWIEVGNMQTILCTETDCIHCKGSYTGHDYSYETRCHEPVGVIISTTKGCQSKSVFHHKVSIGTNTKENIMEILDNLQ